MIRNYSPSDATEVLALNEANVPEVGPMGRDKLDFLVEQSPYFKVVEVGGQVIGLLIVLEEGSSYESKNYAWFSNRYPSFAYVDRVALAAEARGQGWGPSLYEEVDKWAQSASKTMVCAEVNTNPPNPRSLRFHEVNGFEIVGHFQPYDGDEEVAMLCKSLAV